MYDHHAAVARQPFIVHKATSVLRHCGKQYNDVTSHIFVFSQSEFDDDNSNLVFVAVLHLSREVSNLKV